MKRVAQEEKRLLHSYKALSYTNLNYCMRAFQTRINIRTGNASPDKKQLQIVTAFVVLVNIQTFDLFLFRHSKPYNNINCLEENKSE